MGKRPDDTDLPEGLRFLDDDEEPDPFEDEVEEPNSDHETRLRLQKDDEAIHGHPAFKVNVPDDGRHDPAQAGN